MDTIQNYLDNIFQTLPKTSDMERLKTELLSDMEIKYAELRQQGKSENEAIGKVIAEFGNVDELIQEWGLATANAYTADEQDSHLPHLSLEFAKQYINQSIKTGVMVALGVAVILFGVSLMIGLYGFLDTNKIFAFLSSDFFDIMPVALLLLMIIPAVGLFIYAGILMEKYQFIEKGQFKLDSYTYEALHKEMEALSPRKALSITIGVGLCLFGVVIMLLFSSLGDNLSMIGVSIMLLFIAVAVFVFIYMGSVTEAYDKLLKQKEYFQETGKNSKVIGGVAAFVWPVATCVFLVWGFVYNGWGISWIVFPITGILFGAFSGFYSAVFGDKKK